MKKLHRWTAMLMILTLLTCCMPASAQEVPEKDARWYAPVLFVEGSVMHLLTEAQLDVIAKLPSEEIHLIVEAMFTAAAGVREYEEIRLWKTFKKQAEKDARSLENALYRVNTLPWLMAAFAPGNMPDEEYTGPFPTLTPVPTATPTPAPTATPVPTGFPAPEPTEALPMEPLWFPEDGLAAFSENEPGQAFLAMLAPLGGADAELCMAVSQAVVQRWLDELDHDRLYEINDHYKFWLYAAGTPIDYPVVQCGNNSYYLDKLFNRTTNPAGTLFVDYRNLTDFRDPNTLVYGHHMRDSSMFHSLTDYETEGFFDAHPFMVAVDKETIYVLEVFAGYVTDGSDHAYNIALSDEKDMAEFIELAEKKSDFDAHVVFNHRKDHLATLSTCTYHFERARYVVLTRLDLAWEEPDEPEERP